MGTRGLLFIRCRGRYFVIWNQFDSYPEGLGDAIVDEIPTDPEGYRNWLNSMREMYSRSAQKFEEEILTVDVNIEQDDLSISERHAKSYLAVDDRLEYAPIQTIMNEFSNDLLVEWTYTIDLDREMFAVDDAACFKLSNIPHGGQWIRYLAEDARQRRKLGDNTPKDIIADISWKPNIDPNLKVLGQALNIELLSLTDFAAETMLPMDLDAASHPTAVKQMMPARINFLMTTFLQMCKVYRKVLDRFVLGWDPSCFMFREMAFAVLSLAAGEVFFEYPEVLNAKYVSNGYYLLPNSRTQKYHTRMLPRFVHESHLPGIEPGSAPKSTSFWFHNVLVHLNSRLDLDDVEEASVVAVVNEGLGQGHEEFYAMVLSILDVVLIRVQKRRDGKPYIRRSPLMALFEFTEENSGYAHGPRTRPSQSQQGLNKPDSHDAKPKDTSLGEDDAAEEDGSASDISADPAAAGYFTFMLMYHFFNAAAAERLAGTRSLPFPNEILSLIMDFSDMRTYLALAQSSAFCHELSHHKLRLNDEYAVIGSGEDPETFVLEDLHSGKKIHSKLSMYQENWRGRAIADGLKLSPVIGVTNTDRLSIMDDVAIQLSDVTPKDPVWSEPEEGRSREQYAGCSFPRNERGGNSIFDLPSYAYIGAVENAWLQYLSKLARYASDAGDLYSSFFRTILRNRQYRCLLLPGYRELGMEPFRCSGLHAFFRPKRDESPEEWERTLQYVVRQLSILEAGPRDRFQRWGHPVIVAFSTRVKLFYYVFHREVKPPICSNAKSYTVEIAAKCTDPDPGSRLVQLITGEDPIDLYDKEGRMRFESWIISLCKNSSLQYNPYTEQFEREAEVDDEEDNGEDDEGHED
ncbi:uncharacterized protein NFIA_104220 [Aspergillus fischeri NRRL 181]|uniref:F-box domain protein n=1 Tax=Neosartorya fischeri (strain ATCC 1020 / DSM 3700 / CBS 544.65 / FGSC A1164 / JCM 1740 / NRRL 181 / WB 181) TaxID=331117 RepID=A1CWD2_NEOFI|nr:conserved hypothetical protein [Aspergillus fischeri NRRL 181]EAW24934.1 conserved hypothetical protein [Aspergillus fischeri NRRL 181]KAG2027261.1 hypothetical protein GB937_001002 [Aspergillus fischeri]